MTHATKAIYRWMLSGQAFFRFTFTCFRLCDSMNFIFMAILICTVGSSNFPFHFFFSRLY